MTTLNFTPTPDEVRYRVADIISCRGGHRNGNEDYLPHNSWVTYFMDKEESKYLTLRKPRTKELGRIKNNSRYKIFEFFRKLLQLEAAFVRAGKLVAHFFVDEIGFHGYNSMTSGCRVLVSRLNRQECYRVASDEREHVTLCTPVLMVVHPNGSACFFRLKIAVVIPLSNNNTKYSTSTLAPRNATKQTQAGMTLAEFDQIFNVTPKWFQKRATSRTSFADKFVMVANKSGTPSLSLILQISTHIPL